MVTGFLFIFIIGVLGNSMVIYVFLWKHKKRSPMELIIVYLAVSDLVASIMNPFLYIYLNLTGFEQWHFGRFCCTLFPVLTTLSVTVSLGLILLITIERCRVIVNPFNGLFNKKHVRYMVLVVVCLSVLNELPYLTHQTIQPVATVKYNCIKTDGYADDQVQTQYIRKTDYVEHCDTAKASYYINTTSRSYNTNTKISSLSGGHLFCLKESCYQRKFCSPKPTKVYALTRSLTIILRDFIFVVVFISCNCAIYAKLMDPEHRAILESSNSCARLDPRRTLKMLMALALVFAVLVLPKDLYTTTYTLSFYAGKTIITDGVKAQDINTSLKLLQSFNSIANIFIYDKLHTSFKVAFRGALTNTRFTSSV